MGADFTSQPAGLRIVQPPYNGDETLRAFNHRPGSNFSFSITSLKSGPLITGVNFDKSLIESVVDDTGKDLMTTETGDKRDVRRRSNLWDTQPKLSSDGRSVLMQTNVFSLFALPAHQTKRIDFKAKVAILTATGSKQIKTPFDAQLGKSYKVDKLRFELSKVDPKGGYGKTPYRLDFSIYGEVKSIKDVHVLDANGKIIEQSHQNIELTHRSSGKEKWVKLTLRLAATSLEKSVLRVECWTGLGETILPVKIPFTLSLSGIESEKKK